MAETSIARTSIKITTDATGAKAGLDRFGTDVRRSMDQVAANTRASADRIAGEVEASFHKTESKLNKAFGKFAKKEGGFLGFLGSGLAADLGFVGVAAGITGVVLGFQQLIHVAQEWSSNSEDLELNHKRITADLKKAGDAMQDNTKFAAEWRAALPDPRDRVASFDAEIDALERKRPELQSFANETLFSPSVRAEFKKALDDLDKQIRDLIIQRNRAADPAQDPAFVGAINNATQALKDQADTWGLTGTAAQRALFKARGATDKLLEGLDAAAEKLDKLREAERDHLASVERSLLRPSTNPLLSMTGGIVNRLSSFSGNPFLGFAANLSGEIADQIGQRSGHAGFGVMLDTLFQVAGALPKPVGIGDLVRDSLAKSTRPLDNPAALAGTAAEFTARNRDSTRQLTAAEEKQLAEQQKQSALLEQIAGGVKATAQALADLQGLAPF